MMNTSWRNNDMTKLIMPLPNAWNIVVMMMLQAAGKKHSASTRSA